LGEAPLFFSDSSFFYRCAGESLVGSSLKLTRLQYRRVMKEIIYKNLDEASKCLSRLRGDEQSIALIAKSAELMADCLKQGNKIYSCGNGGSHCDAMHFAEELTGRFREDRPPMAATAISDPSHLTCVGNDFGFDEIFARYIMAHGRNGDVLLAISTSGTSKNVIRAAEVAKSLGMKTVCLTGKPSSALGKLSDFDICTPGGDYADRVQELHIKVIHSLIEVIEKKLFDS